jgi:hypothetical protein
MTERTAVDDEKEMKVRNAPRSMVYYLCYDCSSKPLAYDAPPMVSPRELSATVSPSAYPRPTATDFVDIVYSIRTIQ